MIHDFFITLKCNLEHTPVLVLIFLLNLYTEDSSCFHPLKSLNYLQLSSKGGYGKDFGRSSLMT